MKKELNRPQIVVTTIAVSLTTVILLYGLFLLIYGIPGTSFPESLEPGVPPQGGSLRFSPATPQGLILLLCAMMIITGLLARKLAIAWFGVAVLLVFSVLFLFSVGAGLIPLAGLLVLLLGIVTLSRRSAS